MKAVVYQGPRDFSIRDLSPTEPGPTDVLISVHQTGLCGTDKHIHEGDFNAAFRSCRGTSPSAPSRRRETRSRTWSWASGSRSTRTSAAGTAISAVAGARCSAAT